MTLDSLHSVEFFLSTAIGLNSTINSRRLLNDNDFISLYIHLILSLIINHHDNDDQATKRFCRDSQHTKYFEQECIPIGCVPSAAVAVCWGGGVSARWEVPTRGGGVYPSMHWGRHPRGQNSWHTLLKILPCRNFVADGNYYGSR